MSLTHVRSTRLAPEPSSHVANRATADVAPESHEVLAVQRLVPDENCHWG